MRGAQPLGHDDVHRLPAHGGQLMTKHGQRGPVHVHDAPFGVADDDGIGHGIRDGAQFFRGGAELAGALLHGLLEFPGVRHGGVPGAGNEKGQADQQQGVDSHRAVEAVSCLFI